MRLIDADALIKSVGDRWTDYDRELVDSFPAIDLVQCRECVFSEDDGECTGPLAEATMPPEWFCASGQRREDGEAC